MTSNMLEDRKGQEVIAGDFVKLLSPLEGIVPGPYKFEGFRGEVPYFSVAGIDFPLESPEETVLEKIDWDSWKKIDFYLDRFLSYYYKSKAPDSKIA